MSHHDEARLLSVVGVTALIGIAGLAIISDLRSRRIPNALVWRGSVLAILIHLWACLSQSDAIAGPHWWSSMAGLATGLLALVPLYLMRACGAGDVKLMAMVGAFVGPTTVLYAALYTLIAGGVLSLVYMLIKGVAVQTLQNVRFIVTDLVFKVRTGGGARLDPLANTAARLPYAVAITVGTFTALLQHGTP